MPVANQSHLKAQTSFKRFIQLGNGIIVNENNIVLVKDSGEISYLEYERQAMGIKHV